MAPVPVREGVTTAIVRPSTLPLPIVTTLPTAAPVAVATSRLPATRRGDADPAVAAARPRHDDRSGLAVPVAAATRPALVPAGSRARPQPAGQPATAPRAAEPRRSISVHIGRIDLTPPPTRSAPTTVVVAPPADPFGSLGAARHWADRGWE